MPVTILAEADGGSAEALRHLVRDYVEGYAAGSGSTLRLAVADEGALDGVFAAVGDIIDGLARGLDDIPDIEIVPGDLATRALGGEHVVVDDAAERERLLDLGCLPLDGARLPLPPASHVERLRAALGWTHLTWMGATRNLSGFADEIRSYLLALDELGLEPALVDIPGRADVSLAPTTERLLRRCEARRPPADRSTLVWHFTPIGVDRLPTAARRVCRTMFETDTLPSDWPRILAGYDRIWVPSAFNVETFAGAGVDPDRLRILPETVDFDRFAPDAEPLHVPEAEGFRFLCNFDFQDRKGWQPLLTAYATEFAGDPDVTLVLKVSTFHQDLATIEGRVDAFLRTLGAPAATRPRIVISDERLPDDRMPGLYTGSDAYVCPTRGEGWGRPPMEALACGVPVIASRWSGLTAFLDDANAWLVDGSLVPVPDDVDIAVFRGGRWFDPDVDALRAAMRAVADDPIGARAKARAARPALTARFGRGVIAERIAELTLEALCQ